MPVDVVGSTISIEKFDVRITDVTTTGEKIILGIRVEVKLQSNLQSLFHIDS